eukprot:g2821.t1
MTVGVGPVLNGGLHLSNMYITQAKGERNFTLYWRDGHVAGFHPHAYGTMIGNHTMKTANNTPHFNWGVDFPGTVSTSPYPNYDNKTEAAPDCTWITFCTSCCPAPAKLGPDCCCVSSGSAGSAGSGTGIGPSIGGGIGAGHPPDTPQPRVVHWCRKPFCPYKLPPQQERGRGK